MSDPGQDEVSLGRGDLERAVAGGILSAEQVEALLALVRRPREAVERPKGLHWVSVAYYAGALLMISACAWFLGEHWRALGSAGILAVTLVYATAATWLGVWLRRRGFESAGGLLVTVAVCLTPLITYTIEDLLGWWPAMPPGGYADYYPLIRPGWIAMELASVAVSLVALRFVRFGFLTAPLAFSLWFFSMDLAAWLGGEWWDTLEGRRQVSMAVGALMLACGFALERVLRRSERDGEDYAFWSYLFGMLAFWGALTASEHSTELGKALYALLNVGFVALAVWRRRATFLVFGAVGVHLYVAHLAYQVFKNSVLFPFALMLVGLSLIASAVVVQRAWRRRVAV